VHEDTDVDGDVDSNDKWYYDVFDEGWRQLARYREGDSSPKEDFVPHQAGANGYGGSSYIDSVICRNKDKNTAWTTASDGVLEERSYFCQNWRADVSAVLKLVGSSGTELREWDKYSAYGTPTGLPGGDTDSDTDCDGTDVSQVHTWITGSYDVRGDIDLDGDVDATDESTVSGSYSGLTLGRGSLSASGVVNRKGYAGYEACTGLIGGKWLARNRACAADLGEWLRRDPLEYADGVSLYEFGASHPLTINDEFGTECTGHCYYGCEFKEKLTYGRVWKKATCVYTCSGSALDLCDNCVCVATPDWEHSTGGFLGTRLCRSWVWTLRDCPGYDGQILRTADSVASPTRSAGGQSQ
jgi:hypothetical protein